MPLKSGVYQVKVKAVDAKGQRLDRLDDRGVTMGDAVLAWESTLIDVVRDDSANVGLASRTLAMVSGAIYDAVNDIEHTGAVYDDQRPSALAGASRVGCGLRSRVHGPVGARSQDAAAA